MAIYALINYGTGEIYCISGENITCQYLYNRALSQRREARHYGYALDKMCLVKCSNYEHVTQGIVIQEWEGGLNTPIEDLGLNVRTYWTLKKRKCDTVGSILKYFSVTDELLERFSAKTLYMLAKVLKPYDKAAACQIIRKCNLRRINKPLS